MTELVRCPACKGEGVERHSVLEDVDTENYRIVLGEKARMCRECKGEGVCSPEVRKEYYLEHIDKLAFGPPGPLPF